MHVGDAASVPAFECGTLTASPTSPTFLLPGQSALHCPFVAKRIHGGGRPAFFIPCALAIALPVIGFGFPIKNSDPAAAGDGFYFCDQVNQHVFGRLRIGVIKTSLADAHTLA